MRTRRLLLPLSPADVIVVVFLLFLSFLHAVFATRIPTWWIWTLLNGAIIGLVLLLARRAERTPGRLIIGMHRWYLYPIVLYVFKQLYFMIRPIHPIDYDQLLIAIDHWMFGVHPTEWLSQFAHPVLTEILQIAYSSYYLLFIILGVEIYRRRPLQEFDRAGFMIVYGFFLSYLGYFLLPAVGPRFTLHDFHLLDEELPGLFLTEPLRWFVNTGESVPMDVPNPVDFVQRDVFPSGHTQLSLVVVWLAYHFRLSTRHLLAALVTLLVVGTVYLRYHYVIDILAGFLFFLFTIWSARHVESWWNRRKGEWRGEESDAPAAVRTQE